jgi:ribosome-binding protein aMBF1 (putative translation factor)
MPMRKTRRMKTTDAEAILDRLAGNDPTLHGEIEAAQLKMRIAEMILAAREAAQLTQAQLAKRVGTRQRVISVTGRFKLGHFRSIQK